MGKPYIKNLESPLWEMRMKGRSGIARAVYLTAIGKRVVVVPVIEKETPRREIETTLKRLKGGAMMRKFIPVEESCREWRKDPKFVAEYEALEEEFALAGALIEGRGNRFDPGIGCAGNENHAGSDRAVGFWARVIPKLTIKLFEARFEARSGRLQGRGR